MRGFAFVRQAFPPSDKPFRRPTSSGSLSGKVPGRPPGDDLLVVCLVALSLVLSARFSGLLFRGPLRFGLLFRGILFRGLLCFGLLVRGHLFLAFRLGEAAGAAAGQAQTDQVVAAPDRGMSRLRPVLVPGVQLVNNNAATTISTRIPFFFI